MKWLTGRRKPETPKEDLVKEAAEKVVTEHKRLQAAVDDLSRALNEKTLKRMNDG